MVLIDSNIPMYLIGASLSHKIAAERAVETLIAARVRLVTDVEVHQEILHRYRAIDRRDAIQPAFDVLGGIADEVLAVERADVLRAKDLLLARWSLSARDALHLAVMERHGITRILTFDRGFDQVPGIERVPT